MRVVVQEAAFDPGAELTAFQREVDGAGAVVTFAGVVRGGAGAVIGMQIEHYPGMTENALASIADEAIRRWDLIDALIIHRHGMLAVGEPIMMVATASAHRDAAFQAAEFLMDYLKSRAPFWKKEFGPDGPQWVAATTKDEAALDRWQT